MAKSVRATVLRDHLSDVLKEVEGPEKYLIVTRKGKPVSVLVNLDFFEDLLAATSPEYVNSIKEARAQYKAGQTFTHEDAFGEL